MKPTEELARMRNLSRPSAPAGNAPNRDRSLFDKLRNQIVEVGQLFDPYSGAFYEGISYEQPYGMYDGNPASFDSSVAQTYEHHGIELSYYAANSVSNPLTEELFLQWKETRVLGVDQDQERVVVLDGSAERSKDWVISSLRLVVSL